MYTNIVTDIVIVGSGISGLYCALKLPTDKKIVIVTKDFADKSDSYLAQGGICVLRDSEDYDSYFEDTMKAGHYENCRESVDIMIRSSPEVIADLESFGVRFEKKDGKYVYTREGAHSRARILFHKDQTGKEITSNLLSAVEKLENVTILEHNTMVDLICHDNTCGGIICQDPNGGFYSIKANYTVLATGGLGGLYDHSTNYSHLTGDAIAAAAKHGITLQNLDYIQIHPTTLYTEKPGREFLISESVRGEGAILLNSSGNRFVDELLPRDIVATAIYKEMKKENSPCVWLSMTPIPPEDIKTHFPSIYSHCLEEGYDVTKESIPVVPSQHYLMGGIKVDNSSKTSMERLYAVGETSCNGVHGKNRLASNSLLESLVFAGRAAAHISENYSASTVSPPETIDEALYSNYKEEYKSIILNLIERSKWNRE